MMIIAIKNTTINGIFHTLYEIKPFINKPDNVYFRCLPWYVEILYYSGFTTKQAALNNAKYDLWKYQRKQKEIK